MADLSSITPLEISLGELQQNCQDQRQRYIRSRGKYHDSSACDEIVRRAFNRDQAALGVLLMIAHDVALKRAPFQETGEDFSQDVVFRILRRAPELHFSSFPKFHEYLNRTIVSSCCDLLRRDRHESKLEPLDEAEQRSRNELVQPDASDVADRMWLQEICLGVLPNALEREIFLRRYAFDQEINEILQDLSLEIPDLNKALIYDMLASAMRKIRNLPELSSMLKRGSDSVNKAKEAGKIKK